MQVATRDGFELRVLCVGKARALGALKMATRMVAGITREGSIEKGLAAVVLVCTATTGAKEGQVGVM